MEIKKLYQVSGGYDDRLRFTYHLAVQDLRRSYSDFIISKNEYGRYINSSTHVNLVKVF